MRAADVEIGGRYIAKDVTGRFLVEAKVWVKTIAGPVPKEAQIGEALKALLGSDTMTVSVDAGSGGFAAATLACESIEGKTRLIE